MSKVNARESISDIVKGMCCDEETARQCAEEHWRNRNKGTQLVLFIFVSTFACFASALITVIVTVFILSVLWSVLSAVHCITEQSVYLLSAVITFSISIPFWKRAYKTVKEKIHYEYDVYEWIELPASFVTFICIILLSIF